MYQQSNLSKGLSKNRFLKKERVILIKRILNLLSVIMPREQRHIWPEGAADGFKNRDKRVVVNITKAPA